MYPHVTQFEVIQFEHERKLRRLEERRAAREGLPRRRRPLDSLVRRLRLQTQA